MWKNSYRNWKIITVCRLTTVGTVRFTIVKNHLTKYIKFLQVTVTCTCGNRKLQMKCADNEKEYSALASAKLASTMHSMNSAESIDISQIFSDNAANRSEKYKRYGTLLNI